MSPRALAPAIVALACVAAQLLGAAPASAEESIGSCSRVGGTANFAVDYHEDDQFDHIDAIRWDLGGSIGDNNDVQIKVKDDNAAGRDKVYFSYSSGDGVPKGHGSLDLSGKGITMQRQTQMYVEFTVLFDKSHWRPDLGCSAHTRNV